jgi:hypothetical protein
MDLFIYFLRYSATGCTNQELKWTYIHCCVISWLNCKKKTFSALWRFSVIESVEQVSHVNGLIAIQDVCIPI